MLRPAGEHPEVRYQLPKGPRRDINYWRIQQAQRAAAQARTNTAIREVREPLEQSVRGAIEGGRDFAGRLTNSLQRLAELARARQQPETLQSEPRVEGGGQSPARSSEPLAEPLASMPESFKTPAAAALRQSGNVAEPVAAKGAGLEARAGQIHGALDPIAANLRTTAVLRTSGGDVVAGGARDLTPAQRALLGPGETAARLPGAHAEVTAIQHAQKAGLSPEAMAVTRAICPLCAEAIEASGGVVTSPITAVWPR